MKDIFSDLYDKVLSFFVANQETDKTKSVAKNRLKTVLAQDRVGFSERAMQMLKDDLIENISKYLEIDVNAFDLSIEAKEEATVLNLSIPVLRPKTDEEIDEALAVAKNAQIEKTHEIVGEIEELVKQKATALAQTMSSEDIKKIEEKPSEEIEENTEENTEEIKKDTEEEKEEIQEEK